MSHIVTNAEVISYLVKCAQLENDEYKTYVCLSDIDADNRDLIFSAFLNRNDLIGEKIQISTDNGGFCYVSIVLGVWEDFDRFDRIVYTLNPEAVKYYRKNGL